LKKFIVILFICLMMFNIMLVPAQADIRQSVSVAQSLPASMTWQQTADGVAIFFSRKGIQARALWDQSKRTIALEITEQIAGKWLHQMYDINLQRADGHRLQAIAINRFDGKRFEIDNHQLKASFRAIPLIVVLGESMLMALLSTSMIVVLGGVTYVALSQVAERLRTDKNEYYEAVLDKAKGVFVGNPLSATAAATRLNSKSFQTNNVWSISRQAAEQVARIAGNGRKPIFDLPHGTYPKFMPHFHRFDRKGGHSFFSY
jgi:hypothetical protein